MIYLFLCILLAIAPQSAHLGAQRGVELCLTRVLPSLFPFIFLSTLVIKSKFVRVIGALIEPFSNAVLGVGGESAIALIASIFGGYPCGASCAVELYGEGIVTKSECESLLAFCNNGGVFFTLSAISSAFGSIQSALLIFAAQLFGIFVSCRVYAPPQKAKRPSFFEELRRYKKDRPKIGRVISDAMSSTVLSMLTICGFVIFFSALIDALHITSYPFLQGILEMTGGIFALGKMGKSALPFAAFLLSWGGISVHCQTAAVCGEYDISLKKYAAGKCVCAFSAAIAAFVELSFFG